MTWNDLMLISRGNWETITTNCILFRLEIVGQPTCNYYRIVWGLKRAIILRICRQNSNLICFLWVIGLFFCKYLYLVLRHTCVMTVFVKLLKTELYLCALSPQTIQAKIVFLRIAFFLLATDERCDVAAAAEACGVSCVGQARSGSRLAAGARWRSVYATTAAVGIHIAPAASWGQTLDQSASRATEGVRVTSAGAWARSANADDM